MAGTYYNYAERQADSQVNWFQVGKDLTDMLKKETETREKKKAAIDEASRQFGQELENAPQGNSDDVNQWTTQYAADMQQYRLLTDKLLKSGQMKERDYTLIRQNTMDGTKNLFNLAKEYQAEFDAKTARRMEDKSSAAETQFMAMVEGFANLAQTKALINPTTGAISVGKMVSGPDGVKKLAEGPDNYMTVNQLRQRIKQNIDKYDLNTQLEAESKLLGDVVKEVVTKTGSSTETGFITKFTDPTLRKGLSQEGKQAVDAYMETEKQIVAAQLSNPQHISSVLFDWTGGIDPNSKKPYQVTLDPKVAETSTHYILWGYKDGIFQPDFESTNNGKIQKTTAEDYVTNKFRSTLEQKTEIQPFQQPRKEYPPQNILDRQDKIKQENMQGNMIAKLYSGDPTEQQAAITYFGGLPNVVSIQRNNDGITVTTVDGRTKPIPFKVKNTPLTQDDFVRSASSALLGKDVDIEQVVKGSISTRNKTLQPGEVTFSSESTNPNELYGKYISSSITAVPADEADAVKTISPALSKVGFSVREAVIGQDAIVLINPSGEESQPIYLSDPNAVGLIQSYMLSAVPGKDEVEKAMYLKGLKDKGALGGAAQKPQTQQPKNMSIYNKKGGK